MPDYTELHTHSCFSLLDGADTPAALLDRAAALGMAALALTDHDAVYGAVQFATAATERGIKPVFGAEMTLADDAHLTLLAADASGWANLCALITIARHNAPKGMARLPFDALAAYTDGLIALSGCRRGRVPAAILRGDHETARAEAYRCQGLFGDRYWIELQHHLLPEDTRLVRSLVALAERTGTGIVATNNVHYAERDGHRRADLLAAIRHNARLDDCAYGEHLRDNSEYALKSPAQMRDLFVAYPAAIMNTGVIAAQCDFTPEYGLQSLPDFPTPDGLPAADYLRSLCMESLLRRGLHAARAALDEELAVIIRAGLVNYFLIVWDIVRYARDDGILCQGRGSAANSLVAYLLGISPVNPLDHDLVFGRFLSDERRVVPDIDIDFDAARREEVIQYVYQRYGHDHAAMACTFITFRSRSIRRDVEKALGLTADMLHIKEASPADSLKRQLERGFPARLHGSVESSIDENLATGMRRLPRHLGIHNGGMVITRDPIHTRVPTEPATMPDRYVVQWDKDALEDAGLVKIDILGLRMLSVLADCAHAAGADLDALSFDDPAVYDMICAADTVGVFQVESRAQAQILPRLRPRCFNDLIVSISLIRPGPIQGQMVHPYLRRRRGEEPVTYPHPRLENALKETLGVILFQEQVLKVARDMAGFTHGQGELLRRALSSKDVHEAVETMHAQFIAGAIASGVDAATAEDVFDKLRAFGGYSFPKSHAASFAVIVYRSAWLKRYHPAHFTAALLNHQPMGFWSPVVLVSDAKRHGIAVLPVDVNASAYRCTVEHGAVRLGLNFVKGIGNAAGERITSAQPYRDLRDLCRKTRLPHRLIEHLVQAGALDGWGNRRDLLWQLGTLDYDADALPLDYTVVADLPALAEAEARGMEHAMTGLSVGDHLMCFYREHLAAAGILGSVDLDRQPDGASVRVAGLIVMHQAPPTAKGFHFLTLEDEGGFINVIVKPRVYARFEAVIRGAALLIVNGTVQRDGGVVNVVGVRAIIL